ncbi:MAG: aminopeptidase P family protein [Planctomycetota bacterium]|nr:MAG: aminopeptidase P family protein [Planctomycetota bacterium]
MIDPTTKTNLEALTTQPHRFDLSEEGCQARRARLFSRLNPAPDVIIAGSPDQLAYFANFHIPDHVFQANHATAYLVMSPGECTLVHDNLLEDYAELAHTEKKRCVTWYRGLEPAGDRRALVLEEARKELDSHKASRIGVSLARVPGAAYWSTLEKIGRDAITDIDPVVKRLRLQKDEDELQLLRTCGAIVSRVMDHSWKEIEPGMTELELFMVMQLEANRLAGQPVRLYGDVVSGPRCEAIGGPPSHRVIQANELVLLDFSVVVSGYRADIAATKYIGHQPPTELWLRHRACVEALQAAASQLRTGSGAAAIEQSVKRTISQAGFSGTMPGHAGHGVGLMHPEAPFFVARSPETLIGREVVTIEPGIYEKGICGMRIEHDYHVTDTGAERITFHDVETLALA